MQAIFETTFDVIYLLTVITLGVFMICKSKGRKQYLLYGIMAVTLGAGDSFHLVPRCPSRYAPPVLKATPPLLESETYHLRDDDGILCASVLRLALPIQNHRKARNNSGSMGTFGSAGYPLPYAAERMDKSRRPAFLGHLPQYSICAPRINDNNSDIQKRQTERRP